MEYLTVSKTQLAAAFAEWNRQYREHPEDFEEKGDNDESGQVSAEFFIQLLSEVEFPGVSEKCPDCGESLNDHYANGANGCPCRFHSSGTLPEPGKMT